jgi:hypothetical protein
MILAQAPAIQRPSKSSSARPHPYPQTRRRIRPQALGHAHSRRVDVGSDNDYGRPQPEGEEDHVSETNPEQEPGVASDPQLEPDLDVAAGLDLLALVNETKVCLICIESGHIHSQ